MYKESEEGYTEVEGTKFPEGYVLNLSESKCIDNNGNEIKDVLQEEGGNISLRTNKSSYCYLYFDLNPFVKKLLHDRNEDTEINYVGDLWRYQGTDNVNNWICFGTEENCSTTEENIDKYMYRIIGITSDGSLKLIKETFVKDETETKFVWHRSAGIGACENDNCVWPNSTLFGRINGLWDSTASGTVGTKPLFLKNDYYDYLLENNGTKWLGYILSHNWQYGDISSLDDFNGLTIYNIEKSWENISFIDAKIGLQYVHDYILSYPNGDYSGFINIATSWIHFQKDGYNMSTTAEHFMSRRGSYDSLYHNYNVNNFGFIGSNALYHGIEGVRPVFYLTNNIKLSEDTLGTKENPYLINIEA